jgi:hypothetical protein
MARRARGKDANLTGVKLIVRMYAKPASIRWAPPVGEHPSHPPYVAGINTLLHSTLSLDT